MTLKSFSEYVSFYPVQPFFLNLVLSPWSPFIGILGLLSWAGAVLDIELD